jgi:hypothetical protein
MKFSISLIQSESSNEDGFPIYAKVSHGTSRPMKLIGRSWPEHFEAKAQMVTDDHPYYGIMAQKILDLKLRAKTLILQGKIQDPVTLLKEVLARDTSGVTIAEFGAQWISEQRQLMAVYEKKGDVQRRNKISGYVRSVENALVQFNTVVPFAPVAALDYETLMRFRKHNELAGNSTSTIHLYLRTIRAVYNKAILAHRLPDKKPFEGVFSGLKVQSFMIKKKHLEKDALCVLEGLDLKGEKARARDLFLLQFYLGGADLIDIYFLKKMQYKKGRIRFERSKTNTGRVIDVAVHEKAKAILERYPCETEYIFPWRKDIDGYEGFRRRMARTLIKIQDEQNAVAKAAKNDALKIEVLPDDGNLAIKVARHTFANIAKGLMIEPDIIRELMGHERDDVDNYYKDKYPQAVRDEAHFRIIG